MADDLDNFFDEIDEAVARSQLEKDDCWQRVGNFWPESMARSELSFSLLFVFLAVRWDATCFPCASRRGSFVTAEVLNVYTALETATTLILS